MNRRSRQQQPSSGSPGLALIREALYAEHLALHNLQIALCREHLDTRPLAYLFNTVRDLALLHAATTRLDFLDHEPGLEEIRASLIDELLGDEEFVATCLATTP